MDNVEEHVMHSKSGNIEIMVKDEAVIKEFFDPIKNRYQNHFESVKRSEFVFMFRYYIINMR